MGNLLNEAPLHPDGATDGLGTRIRQLKDKIIKLWAERVRKEVVAAKNLEPSTLMDSIPDLLENLAQALEKPGRNEVSEIKVAQKHGQERATIPRYSIDQVIFEYRLLRRTIFDVLTSEGEESISPWERDIVIDAIEVGISEATASYADYQYRLREQFIAVLAHDLRTPLTAALSSAQLILRYPEKIDATQVLAARIIDRIARTDRMIQDLLDTNRIRASEALPLKMENADLRVIVRTTLDELSSALGDHFEFTSGLTAIWGAWDIGLLKRAIENLVINAKKYGSTNIPVTINLTQNEDDVTISVHNEGNPISDDDQVTIFDPFQRSQSALAGGQIGWGIGLPFVRGVAESHHGTISVKSTEKEGTTFFLKLPRDFRVGRVQKAA